MKWTIVLVACLVAVGANLEEEDKESVNSLPILRIKQLGEDAVLVPPPKKESNSSEDTASTDSSQEVTILAEENNGNELKRVKKSPGLTTICVEIKPTSPYEPPYFMCKGTEPEYGSHGVGYKPFFYGGKPSSGSKGGSFGYGKPSHGGSSYGSHEEYSVPASGGYGKPKPEKYIHESHSHGISYGSSGAAYEGIDAYGKPIKYKISHGKPSAPYGGYGGGYEAHGPAGYGKPVPHYKPQHGVQYGKPYGGEGYHTGPSYHPAHGYGAGYGSAPSYGNGPAFKGGSKPTSYDYGKQFDKYHAGNKGSAGYSAPAGAYRTITMEGDDDDDEEINEVEEVTLEPQVGMPIPYSSHRAPTYPKPPAQVYSYPSPAPKVPCGTNLLVGCNPSVQPVPCYGTPAAQQPSIVYNIQPSPPAYAPPAPPTYSPARPTYAPPAPPAYNPARPMYAPDAYNPVPPPYPQQRTATGEMTPGMENQQPNTQKIDTPEIQNSQSRTQGDGMAKPTDAEIRFQQGSIDTAPQQDDKLRPNTENVKVSTGVITETKQPTSNQFQHPGVLRQMEDTTRKIPAAQEMSMNMAEGARQQPEVADMKTSDGNDAERKKIDAMIRMQQMRQMAQGMGTGAPKMANENNANMNYAVQGW